MIRLAVLVASLACLIGCAANGPAPARNNQPSQARLAAETQTQMAQEYLRKGQLDIALDRAERARQLDPGYAAAHSVLGVILERIGHVDRAERSYRRAVELAPESGDLLNNLGQFLCRAGRYAEAETQFRAALKDPFYRTPEVAEVNAGICAHLAGRYDDAERYFRQALRRKPDHAEVFLPLARTLLAKGEPLQARAFVQRYEATRPESPEALLLGYEVEVAMRDARAAAEYRQRLKTSFPQSAEARRMEEPGP